MYVAAPDVPLLVVTVTLTAPAAVPAGAVTVSEVADADVTVAALDPKSTVSPDAVALNAVPVMVTVVPPASGPLVGLIDVIDGALLYVYVAAFDVPLTVATVTLTEPAEPAGAVAVSEVDVGVPVTVAVFEPNLTVSPDAVVLKPVPVMVTVFPPAGAPLVGLMLVIVGAALYVYVTAFDVPLTVATVTLTVPEPAGAVTVSEVADADVTVAAELPKSTVSADAVALKPVPVMVTEFPPPGTPLFGLIVEITGAALYV